LLAQKIKKNEKKNGMSHSRALSLVGGGDPETYNLMENSVYELSNHEWKNWCVTCCAKKDFV
jgi:hypothetical protein